MTNLSSVPDMQNQELTLRIAACEPQNKQTNTDKFQPLLILHFLPGLNQDRTTAPVVSELTGLSTSPPSWSILLTRDLVFCKCKSDEVTLYLKTSSDSPSTYTQI